jgi:hypothetical protein
MSLFDRDRIRALWKRSRRLLVRINRTVPPGLRLVLGLILIAGGILGFLPVLGFWMIPLGVGVAWLDFRAVWRVWKTRKDT